MPVLCFQALLKHNDFWSKEFGKARIHCQEDSPAYKTQMSYSCSFQLNGDKIQVPSLTLNNLKLPSKTKILAEIPKYSEQYWCYLRLRLEPL